MEQRRAAAFKRILDRGYEYAAGALLSSGGAAMERLEIEAVDMKDGFDRGIADAMQAWTRLDRVAQHPGNGRSNKRKR